VIIAGIAMMFFCLETRTKNSSQQVGFFAALGLCPANPVKPGLESFTSRFAALSRASVKISYALQPHRARIVLPDFARSLSAVGL